MSNSNPTQPALPYDEDGELKRLYTAITGRPGFSYAPSSDPLYRSYAERYIQNGRLAMRDSMGQGAALTGGYGSSYAQSVGQQQYNEYLRSLGEVLPELYGLAWQRYSAEGEQLQNAYDLAWQRRENEYQRGRDALSDERYADAALYIGSRRIIAGLAHKGHKADYSDLQVKELLRAYIDEGVGEIRDEGAPRRVIVVGGDYFSAQQYAAVRQDGDNAFGSMAQEKPDAADVAVPNDAESGDAINAFFTETLAQIYADQGYPEQAAQIYSRLSLRFPEKSAYFASLIEKLKN